MCYLGPTTAAIVTTFMWRSKKRLALFWLMLIFYGGSLFGIVDHLWNGELFLVSQEWVKDIVLGIVITAGTVFVWAVVLTVAKRDPSLSAYLKTSR